MAKTQAQKDADKAKRKKWAKEQGARNRKAKAASEANKKKNRDKQKNLQATFDTKTTKEKMADNKKAKDQSRTQNPTASQKSRQTQQEADALAQQEDRNASLSFEDFMALPLTAADNKLLPPEYQQGNDEAAALIAENNPEDTYSDVTPTGIRPTFSDVEGGGLDDDSFAQDLLDKYGGLILESGRRGSIAKDSIYQEGDPLLQGFVGSDAYTALQNDTASIADEDVQQRLSDAGIDWKAFAYGRTNDSTGATTYNDLDFEMLDKYIQTRLNPLKAAGSVAGDIMAAGTIEPSSTVDAETVASITNSNYDEVPPAPTNQNVNRSVDPAVFGSKKV